MEQKQIDDIKKRALCSYCTPSEDDCAECDNFSYCKKHYDCDYIFKDLLEYVEQLQAKCDRLNDFEQSQCAKMLAENGKLKNLIEQAIEDLENCYGRETPLTRDMWEAVEGSEQK